MKDAVRSVAIHGEIPGTVEDYVFFDDDLGFGSNGRGSVAVERMRAAANLDRVPDTLLGARKFGLARALLAGSPVVRAGGAIGHVLVLALPRLYIAAVQGAVVVIVAVDAEAQHGVLAPSFEANARQPAEVAWRIVGGGAILARTVDRVAGVDRALVLIVTVDTFTTARQLTDAASAAPLGSVQVAGDAILDSGVTARPCIEVADVVGALVEVVTVFGSVAGLGSTGPTSPAVAAASTRAVRRSATSAERHLQEKHERAGEG